jgi:hypothetical protein
MFSVLSLPKCYKQERWSSELVVRQSPACKNLSTETEDIVGIRHKATTGENIASSEDFMCAVATVISGVFNSVRLSWLFIATFCKCSINSITNPKPFHSHSYT